MKVTFEFYIDNYESAGWLTNLAAQVSRALGELQSPFAEALPVIEKTVALCGSIGGQLACVCEERQIACVLFRCELQSTATGIAGAVSALDAENNPVVFAPGKTAANFEVTLLPVAGGVN